MLTAMPDTPEQRPEGALLQEALKRKRISVREAAGRASISEGRWRQIVLGYQAASRGQRVEVIAPASTLAKMAWAVNVTPDELVAAGRSDAAEALREMGDADERDDAIIRVMKSSIPDERKKQLVKLLIAERQAIERERINRADGLIAMFEENNHT